ncbi:hypothetical protein AALO_G00070020 [Alosa alosa]|uniref:Apolipoprotein E n=1 Tax=Alosa alosa TaxID=278164 RepID=A0AAV6H1V5_9TELE|nr:hypothetical protein AALO_G00070020 [Alosa alosa]
MKQLAYLVLTLFVGICQSRSPEDFDPEWDNVHEDYDFGWRSDMWKLMQKNALSKTISDKVSESVKAIDRYSAILGRTAGSMFYDLGSEVEQEGQHLVSEVERHVEKTVPKLRTQAETFARDVQQLNATLEDIQKKAIVVVQDFHGQLTQSAQNIRKKTESFIGSIAQSMQSHLATVWESLKKAN